MKCSVVTLLAASESDSVLLTSKHPGKKTGRRKIPVKLLRRQKTQDSVKVRHQPMMVVNHFSAKSRFTVPALYDA